MMRPLRRLLTLNNLLHQYHFYSLPMCPLSIAPLTNPINKRLLTTKNQFNPKKTKIKIPQDEYNEVDENTEEIEEATIEKETKTYFRQTASQTISDIKFSDDETENKTYKSKLSKYIGIHIGLDNILPRMISLSDKDSEAITKTMNSFWISNIITGIPFFLLCWQCSNYIIYPELILSYLIMRYTTHYVPGTTINRRLVEVYKLKYPLLNKCNWSRKLPDPTRQNVDAFAEILTTKISILEKIQSKIPKYLKDFRYIVYANPIKHGFAWDVANNTRMIIGIPLLFGLFHYGGIGLYITDLSVYNPIIAQWACIYIGASYGARITSNWALRTMVLTTIEKRYGLRNESGEYFGYKKSNINRKGTMDNDNNFKLSSKPKRK
eukprot:46791_1